MTLWNEGPFDTTGHGAQATHEILRKLTMHYEPQDVSIGILTGSLHAYRSWKVAARSSDLARFTLLMVPDASESSFVATSEQPTEGAGKSKVSNLRDVLIARALHRESRIFGFDSRWDASKGTHLLHSVQLTGDDLEFRPESLKSSPGATVDDIETISPKAQIWRQPDHALDRELVLQSGERQVTNREWTVRMLLHDWKEYGRSIAPIAVH
jgi:hypothetical protein